MSLDIREILFIWVHKEPYYGNWENTTSAIAAIRRGQRRLPHHVTTRLWDDFVYEDTVDRINAWLEIDLALGRMKGIYRCQLSSYLSNQTPKPFEEWEQLPTPLWMAITEALTGIIGSAENE
jgi:hypothetical protein